MKETNEERLVAFSKLEKNWDSYNGNPIHPVTVMVVRRLLKCFEDMRFPEPHIFPSPDGTISLAWGEGDQFENFTLGVGMNGVHSIYIADNNGFYVESNIEEPERSGV